MGDDQSRRERGTEHGDVQPLAGPGKPPAAGSGSSQVQRRYGLGMPGSRPTPVQRRYGMGNPAPRPVAPAPVTSVQASEVGEAEAETGGSELSRRALRKAIRVNPRMHRRLGFEPAQFGGGEVGSADFARAVAAYQQSNGLGVDGIAGPMTCGHAGSAGQGAEAGGGDLLEAGVLDFDAGSSDGGGGDVIEDGVLDFVPGRGGAGGGDVLEDGLLDFDADLGAHAAGNDEVLEDGLLDFDADIAGGAGDQAGRTRDDLMSIDAPKEDSLMATRGTIDPGVQRMAAGSAVDDSEAIRAEAAAGVAGSGGALPHLAEIQASFGRHDVSAVQAHVGGAAADASTAIGAEAYATGNHVAFRSAPDLHTAAHEATHVVQQRAGVQLKGGVGEVGDAYEQHADAVADRVVQGESAQDLLDPVAAGSGAGSATGPVQRLMAQDIESAHLGQQNREYTTATQPAMRGPKPFHGPSGGVELFSGTVDTHIEWDVRISPTYSLELLEEDLRSTYREGDYLPAGTPPQVRRDTGLADWLLGPGAEGYGGSRIVREEEDALLAQQRPEPIDEYARYRRQPSDSPWYVMLNSTSAEYFHALGRNLELNGSHSLTTAGDGQLLASLTMARVAQPWPDLLLDQPEIEGFKQVFEQTQASSAAKDAWYSWARTGIYGGADAQAWILSSMNNEEQQFSLVRSLQHLIVAEIPQANRDLNQFVDALRELIESDDTDATTRTILQNRLVNSHFWSELRIDRSVFPNEPLDTPDTADAQFDLIRLAGKVLAERRLIAGLRSTLDPVAFINASPDDAPHPARDLFEQVIIESNAIRDRILTFMASEVTAANLGPACFGPESLCGQEAETRGLGREMTNHELALEAGRIGAAEAIHNAAAEDRGSTSLFTKRLGTMTAMGRLTTLASSGRPGAPVTLFQVVNRSAGELQPLIVSQAIYLKTPVAEELRRRRGANAEIHRRRGEALDTFADAFALITISTDLANLRGAFGGAVASTMQQASIQNIQSHLANQAMIGKTQALLAFEAAYTRYVGELMENIRGKINEKRGGPAWVSAGLSTLKGSRHIVGLIAAGRDFSAARAGASSATQGIKLLGASLAVAGVVIDAGIGIRNYFARRRIAREERRILQAAAQGMQRYRARAFTRIEASASTEQSHYARGHVRSADGFEAYLTGLTSGDGDGGGNMPGLVDITQLENSQLDVLFDAVVATEGVPYNDLYQAQLAMIANAGDPLWRDFESQIDGLPRVW